MAVTTTDVSVSPQDGWKLIATAPKGPILLKPHSTRRAWFLAIAGSAPSAGLRGVPMGRSSGEDNQFSTDLDLTENIYIRVPPSSVASAAAIDNQMLFSIISGAA